MSQERIRILELLQQGQITTDEALERLARADQNQEKEDGYHKGNAQQKYESKESQTARESTGDSDWFRDLGQKIRETVENVLESDFRLQGKEEHLTLRSSVGNGIEILDIEGKNAKITMESSNDEELQVEITYRQRNQSTPAVALVNNNRHITLEYDRSQLHMLKVKILVPENIVIGRVQLTNHNAAISVDDVAITDLVLFTTNASIKVNDVSGDRLECQTRSGSIQIEDVQMQERITAMTTNATIKLEDSQAKVVVLETTNGTIHVEDADVVDLDIKTTNAKVKMEDLICANEERYRIHATTTNGSIALCFDEIPEACKIQAETTNGRIDVGIDDMIFHQGKHQRVSATSVGYETARQRVDIELATSNGRIEIQ